MARKNAPSRKKSLGYYAKVKKGKGTGKKAVTTPPSKLKKGSKAYKRRKAFCARSRSWTSERGKAARRKWNC